jgi:hypothetical protein
MLAPPCITKIANCHTNAPYELNRAVHVMRGLDPRIHPLRLMDCRVKPGNDDGEVRYNREQH